MCPITSKYIEEIYIDRNNTPIRIDNRITTDVIKNAQEVLAKVKRGANIIFPDIISIYNCLVNQLLSE